MMIKIFVFIQNVNHRAAKRHENFYLLIIQRKVEMERYKVGRKMSQRLAILYVPLVFYCCCTFDSNTPHRISAETSL